MTDSSLHWATEVAVNLAQSGSIGLGSLVKSLSSPDTRRWFIDTQNVPDDFAALLKMLRWAMSFPSVYCIRIKSSPELGGQLTKSAEKINSIASQVLTLDPASPTVRTSAMGLEGHAASLYWRQLKKLIPEEFGFCRRVTQGASDPINQCLNYVYGMLYSEVWRAVTKEGLDPYFGLIHGSKRDQGSLVFDLIEEFRAPFADRLILGMLGRGFLPAIGDHGALKAKTRRMLALSFMKNWFKKVTWRSRRLEPTAILAQQARCVAKLFNREGGYHPYKMRW